MCTNSKHDSSLVSEANASFARNLTTSTYESRASNDLFSLPADSDPYTSYSDTSAFAYELDPAYNYNQTAPAVSPYLDPQAFTAPAIKPLM